MTKRLLTAAYGALAYLAFLLPTLYLFAFLADVGVPKTVNRGAGPLGPPLAVDLVLLLLFGVQHSIMARPFFKRALQRWLPETLERSTYVLASGITLILVYWLWRPLPAVIWDVHGTPLATLAWIGYAGGWALAVWATFALSHFHLFGVAQIAAAVRSQEPPQLSLRRTMLYRTVRHPMTTGLLIAFWCTPRMTHGHLLFAGGMTLYSLVATALEERDLLRSFGDGYETYRRQVPALIPLLRPGVLAPRTGTLVPDVAGIAVGIGLATWFGLGALSLPDENEPGLVEALPALEEVRIEVSGTPRSYLVFDPDPAASGERVLVLALHGTGGSGVRLQSFLGGALERVARERGWIVVYPEALEGAWNDCRADAFSRARTSRVDDVAFLRTVVGALVRDRDIDPGNVVLLGFSGGGHMAFRAALEAPGLLRAVTVFGASLPVDGASLCDDRTGPIPIQIVNGTNDLVNPYAGGEVLTPAGRSLGAVRSTEATARYFRERSNAEVELVPIEGGGHAVPGPLSRFPRAVGRVDRSYAGIREAADFFQKHLNAREPGTSRAPAPSGPVSRAGPGAADPSTVRSAVSSSWGRRESGPGSRRADPSASGSRPRGRRAKM